MTLALNMCINPNEAWLPQKIYTDLQLKKVCGKKMWKSYAYHRIYSFIKSTLSSQKVVYIHN